MKKMFCLIFILITCQSWSQVKSGVYQSEFVVDFEFNEGVQVGSKTYNEPMLLHITENGFRVYKKENDTGNSYPMIYIGQLSDGFHVYAVPFGDRLEINNDLAVLFSDFDNNTGWYQSSREYRSLSFLYEKPQLK